MKPFLPYEFHVSKRARDRYSFDESLFSTDGRVIFKNFNAARRFAQQINKQRDLSSHPEQGIRPGEINALGLLDEIQHHILREYQRENNPLLFLNAWEWLVERLGNQTVEATVKQFLVEFPPVAVYRNEITIEEYLNLEYVDEDGTRLPSRQVVLEEMLILWLTNENPASAPFIELFDDSRLEKETSYLQIIKELNEFFKNQPLIQPESLNLIDFLRTPAQVIPGSLLGQLEYIRTHWSSRIQKFISELLSSFDLIREETKPIFIGGGPGPALVPDYSTFRQWGDLELERFSQDLFWMPNLVLIAKNVYVWLDQLANKYRRPINHLDEIPDEEFEYLAHAGITGLWLIGLWERSPASQTIKKLRGNPEAVASAYSLFSYDIANDLGGEEAFSKLKRKAGERGIRLASDMVPNHMGIDSRWVIEHPDWFISLDQSPFPSYTFYGPNLSWDQRVGIYIEDHYYNNTDAAVVFKRVDFWTGQEKYIYHGNDGTSMPWNDTAQLNYLIPEVREAVIQTILHVARKTPIIRFDAAMTLTKRHYQRLWFPEPGSGGDIPSRAGLGLSKEQFDAVFPEEFWREVVDRVAKEAPDTLLLAEAFWLMEGYFVRTLGMHRVYNSAFMNMLRDEKNQEYRQVIKNTIEFDPEILKRYVNFMNNPDERTAVDQFGKGDKYFGICTMMVTLPGLPMFGHGQLEGYTEKYGMEYKRAYWQEQPDPYLLERHEKEIFPLLHQRYLFAEVENFRLYDFVTPQGNVDEDVFAYSNRLGDQRILVVYHNRFKSTRGWIHKSSAFPEKRGEEKELVIKVLGEALDLPNDPDTWVIFQDTRTKLEYLRNSTELHQYGLYIELNAYTCFVFHNFRFVKSSPEQPYVELATYLQGGGVPDIQEALQEYLLRAILTPYKEIVNEGFYRWLVQNRFQEQTKESPTLQLVLDESEAKLRKLLHALAAWLKDERNLLVNEQVILTIIDQTITGLRGLLSLSSFYQPEKRTRSKVFRNIINYLFNGPNEQGLLPSGNYKAWSVLFTFLFSRAMIKLLPLTKGTEENIYYLDQWHLLKISNQTMNNLGLDHWSAQRAISLVRFLFKWEGWFENNIEPKELALNWLKENLEDPQFQKFISVNRYNNILWFNKENFDEAMWWLFISATINNILEHQTLNITDLFPVFSVIETLLTAEDQSGYQLERLVGAKIFS